MPLQAQDVLERARIWVFGHVNQLELAAPEHADQEDLSKPQTLSMRTQVLPQQQISVNFREQGKCRPSLARAQNELDIGGSGGDLSSFTEEEANAAV